MKIYLGPALTPVAFHENVPATGAGISRGNPYSTWTGPRFPPPRLPCVGMTIPAVIAGNPYMIAAGAKAAMLHQHLRRTKFYYDFSLSSADANGEKGKQ
jgi:hypothetical protein